MYTPFSETLHYFENLEFNCALIKSKSNGFSRAINTSLTPFPTLNPSHKKTTHKGGHII
jgi:hypothetical protein